MAQSNKKTLLCEVPFYMIWNRAVRADCFFENLHARPCGAITMENTRFL